MPGKAVVSAQSWEPVSKLVSLRPRRVHSPHLMHRRSRSLAVVSRPVESVVLSGAPTGFAVRCQLIRFDLDCLTVAKLSDARRRASFSAAQRDSRAALANSGSTVVAPVASYCSRSGGTVQRMGRNSPPSSSQVSRSSGRTTMRVDTASAQLTQ